MNKLCYYCRHHLACKKQHLLPFIGMIHCDQFEYEDNVFHQNYF